MAREKTTLIALLGLLSLGAAKDSETHPHWSYSGNADPTHWGSLEPGFAACAKGKEQSPINIDTSKVRHQKLPSLVFDYRTSPLHITNNGHSIQIDVPAGSTLTIAGHRYALVQFHFHHPSEETIDGKPSDMVAHLVHRDADSHLAVVAILLKAGEANSLLGTLWTHLPREEGHTSQPAKVAVNATELLPRTRDYYTFRGSLTTPPCSENVRWFVLKSATTLSTDQLETFSRLYPSNARPVQPLNGRVVVSNI